MTPAQRRLAEALDALKLQDAGRTVIKSGDLARLQRESLVGNGFLRLIVKGWYMPSRPGSTPETAHLGTQLCVTLFMDIVMEDLGTVGMFRQNTHYFYTPAQQSRHDRL